MAMRLCVAGCMVAFCVLLTPLEVAADVAAEVAAVDKPANAKPLREGFVQLDLHYSMLTDLSDRATIAPSFGYALKGGYRWGNWGIFGQFEHNLWVATELDKEVVQGAYNVGVGADVSYFNGRVRTSLAFGPSFLAFDTELDDRGSVGLFFDLRPVGIRWDVHRHMRIGLDPLSFVLVAPVLEGIPLVQIQYRTSLYLEGRF